MRFALISFEAFQMWLRNAQALPGGEMLASFLVGLMIPNDSNKVTWATLEQIAASVQQEQKKPATEKKGPGRPPKKSTVEHVTAEVIQDSCDSQGCDIENIGDYGSIGPDSGLIFGD